MSGAQAIQDKHLELNDGTKVHVRPLHAEDEEALHDAFARMSERSVYFRFFSPLKRLPEELAHKLAQVDGDVRFAFCATHRLGHEHDWPRRVADIYVRCQGAVEDGRGRSERKLHV